MSTDAKCRLASAAFATLLILSVFWPSPVVGVNQLCCNAHLSIDELSFLGREAPSWDVIFWCIVGVLALALLQDVRGLRSVATEFRATRVRLGVRTAIALAVSALIACAMSLFVAARPTAF